MTNMQAKDILEHLTNELVRNGYGEVVRVAKIRMEESSDGENSDVVYSEENYRFQLRNFIFYAREVLSAISSKSVARTIARFNEHLATHIDEIYVDLITGERRALSELPDYEPVIRMLEQINEEIKD